MPENQAFSRKKGKQIMRRSVVMLLASIVLCHYILIIPEEQYLAAKFGKEYEEYVASVHRWLGRK